MQPLRRHRRALGGGVENPPETARCPQRMPDGLRSQPGTVVEQSQPQERIHTAWIRFFIVEHCFLPTEGRLIWVHHPGLSAPQGRCRCSFCQPSAILVTATTTISIFFYFASFRRPAKARLSTADSVVPMDAAISPLL